MTKLAATIAEAFKSANEAKSDFDPKDMSFSSSPTLMTVDGKGYISYIEDERKFEINPDHENDDLKYAWSFADALRTSKTLGMKFTPQTLKDANDFFNGKRKWFLCVAGKAINPSHNYRKSDKASEAEFAKLLKEAGYSGKLEHLTVGYSDMSVILQDFSVGVDDKKVVELAKKLAKVMTPKTPKADMEEFGGSVQIFVDDTEESGNPEEIQNFE